MQDQLQLKTKQSTPQELSEFLNSNVYKDFTETLNNRIKVVQYDLENANDMDAVKRLQGELVGLRFWDILPRAITESILEESDNAAETDD